MLIIGLTGNIGSGKSTVSRRLAGLGAEVIDADRIARELVEPGSPVLEIIKAEFGKAVLDSRGRLDRKAMAGLVFGDPGARARLESIIHPRVFQLARQRVEEYRRGRGKAPVLVVEAPLLIETGMQEMVDETWLVAADLEVRIDRVMKRDGATREEVMSRVRAQMPQEEKAKYALHVIDNNGTVEETEKQVDSIWREIVQNPQYITE